MTTDAHWLYTWINEYEIDSPNRAVHLLASGQAVQRFHELASANNLPPDNFMETDIIAGYTLDLNSRITCSQYECVAKGLDRLFSRVWHYFDRVVVQGPSASDWSQRIERTPNKDRIRMAMDLKEDVAILLHIRKIGAEPYMAFRDKPYRSCLDDHFQEHAAELRLGAVIEPARQEVTDAILEDAEIRLEREGCADWVYWYSHPVLKESITGYCHQKKRPAKQQIARLVHHKVGINLVSDLSLAQSLRLPLALTSALPAVRPLSDASRGTYREEDLIALELALPVMSGVTAKDLLRFREDNWPHFERFRLAVRHAIREQMTRLGSAAPADIARAVSGEFIEPELANIERQLRIAKKSLSAKSGTVFSVGLALTTVGFVIAAPIVVAAGAAAAGLLVPSILKYIEDRNSIETSDLYFLWRATQAD